MPLKNLLTFLIYFIKVRTFLVIGGKKNVKTRTKFTTFMASCHVNVHLHLDLLQRSKLLPKYM